MTLGFVVACLLSAAPTSQPAEQVELQVRVIYGNEKQTPLDPKLKDLQGSLKDLKFTGYELKDQTSLKLALGGAETRYVLPLKRHLLVSAVEKKQKGKQTQVLLKLAIPELKFKTSAWVSPGATLVVGGPKFEEGVLLFALGCR